MNAIKKLGVYAAACLASAVLQAGTLENGVLTFNVASGETESYTTQLTSGISKIVKLGAGTLVISNDQNSTFAGTTEIREGILEIQTAQIATIPTLGNTKARTITVSDGAQLRVVMPKSNSQDTRRLLNEVRVAGSGPDGTGAVRLKRTNGGGSSNNCDGLFSYLTLTGDATLGSNARFGIVGGVVDFGGHTLTLSPNTASEFMLYGGTWKNGSFTTQNGMCPIFQGNNTVNADATFNLVSTRLGFWNTALTFNGRIEATDGASLSIGSGTADNVNNIAGPINIQSGTLTLTTYGSTAGMRQHLSGPISGAGGLKKANDSYVWLECLTNSYAGGTTVAGSGVLYVKAPGSLPGYDVSGKTSVGSGSNLSLEMGDGLWTGTEVHDLLAAGSFNANAWLWLETPEGVDATFADGLPAKTGYRHRGAGSLTVPGAVAEGACLRNDAGTLTFTGGERHLGSFHVPGGTVVLDGGYMHVTNTSSLRLGGANTSAGARMVLRNGAGFNALATNITTVAVPNSVNVQTFNIGDTKTKPAILEINDTSCFTGKVVGVSGGKYAIYLHGGEFVQMSGPTADAYLGNGIGGYAYLGQTGGTFVMRAHTGMAKGGGTGIYEMKGGNFKYQNSQCLNFTLSRGYGHGEFYQTGGTFDVAAINRAFYMGIQAYSDTTGGTAVATLNGADAYMRVNNFDMGLRLTNFVSTLNLMAGTLETKYIEHATTATRINCPGYVNFNGGTFRALADNTDLFGSGVKKCDRVTVFGGGAVFDSNGHSMRVCQVPLSAPRGKGIASIAIPDSANRTGYVGPPEVIITGDGTGATAHCCFDEETGIIGPIVVTSPGWDYTTAAATIKNAGRTEDVACTVELAELPGGGITKRGEGTLELACANGFSGATRVEAGTLKLTVSGAISATNDLLLAGGTVNLNGLSHTVARVGGFGTITNGTLTVTDGLVFDAQDVLTNATFSVEGSAAVTLPTSPDVRLLNEDALPSTNATFTLATFAAGTFTSVPQMPDTGKWRCAVSADGASLLLVRRADVSLSKDRPCAGTPIVVNFENGTSDGCTYAWYRAGTDGEYASQPFSTSEAYTPTVEDYEHWIKVVVTDSAGTLGEDSLFFSRLPVVYLSTDDGLTPTAQKEEHDGWMRFQGNDAWPKAYDGAMTIKVRGNSTKNYPKKPWKVKLDKKTAFFGNVKNKHWVFLANYLDECMMRNTVAFNLSGQLGLIQMHTDWVDVVFNGSYNGCYQLCEHIRVGSGRVDIYDWEDAAGSVAEKFAAANGLDGDQEDELATMLEEDFSWVTTDSVTYGGVTAKPSKLWKKFKNDITGGYLFEMSSEYDELSQFVVTSGVMTVKTMLNKPEYLYSNPEMMSVCQDLWQRFWDACSATNGYNSAGEHWSEITDVDTMTSFWLVNVFMANSDSSKKSRYAYKGHGEKLKFGPVWDFDWGCGSPVTLSTNSVGYWTWSSATNSWNVATSEGTDDKKLTKGGFYKEWADDPWFCLLLWEKYWSIHPYLESLVADGGILDTHAAYLAEAGAANEAKWFYRVGFSGADGDVARFKKFLTDRLNWLDKKFVNVSTFMTSVRTSKSAAPYTQATTLAPTIYGGGVHAVTDSVETVVVDVSDRVNRTFWVDVAVPSGATVELYVNGLAAGTCAVEEGKASFRVPGARLTAAVGKRNCLSFIAKDADGRVVLRNYAFVLSAEAGSDGIQVRMR